MRLLFFLAHVTIAIFLLLPLEFLAALHIYPSNIASMYIHRIKLRPYIQPERKD